MISSPAAIEAIAFCDVRHAPKLQAKKFSVSFSVAGNSAITRIGDAILPYLPFIHISDCQQHRLGINQVASSLAMIFLNACFDDCIDWTSLFAEPAKNALGEIDIVSGGAARPVIPDFGIDGNGRTAPSKFDAARVVLVRA